MRQFVRSIRRHAERAAEMEPFVRWIVGGGVALVAGLWLARLTASRSRLWILGVALAVVGIAGLTVGIGAQIEYP
ncbi:MAG: hypothetical protein ABEK02_09355 [Haloquadratum sp.]